jgi:hypothetical protein
LGRPVRGASPFCCRQSSTRAAALAAPGSRLCALTRFGRDDTGMVTFPEPQSPLSSRTVRSTDPRPRGSGLQVGEQQTWGSALTFCFPGRREGADPGPCPVATCASASQTLRLSAARSRTIALARDFRECRGCERRGARLLRGGALATGGEAALDDERVARHGKAERPEDEAREHVARGRRRG